MPLTEVNLNDIINGMESEQTTLRYSLGEGLKGRKDSVSVRRYIAHMKSEGSFGDADLWEAMAKGNKVQTPFGLMEPAISGSFDAEDAPFDPKRNKVYVKVTPPKAIRDALKKIVPERLDEPEVPLEIAAVITSSLGKKGYNAIKVGEPFAVSGRGLSDEVCVELVDRKGVRHEAAVETAKDTLILCGPVSAAMKGAATLEVFLASEEPNGRRFAASRKVTVL